MRVSGCVAWWFLISCLPPVSVGEDGSKDGQTKRPERQATRRETVQTTEAAPSVLEVFLAPEGPPPVDLYDPASIWEVNTQKPDTPVESDPTDEEVAGSIEVDLPEQGEDGREDGKAVDQMDGAEEPPVEEERVHVSQSTVNDSEILAKVNDSGQGENIPSFNEWTQQKIAEEVKSGSNGDSQPAQKNGSGPKLATKNYASPDCGAKVIAANAEAEHTSHILIPSRDEYFLSPCSAKIWFIVELCEAIQAQRFEIANFELFSSSPKDFKVYINDQYPRRDWTLLGQFQAVDERTVQNFSVEQKVFAKFVKVELVSHYGREHFCPISLFNVYGNSEYEVIAADNVPAPFSTDEEPAFPSHAVPDRPSGGPNILNSAKNVVIGIVNRAVNIIGKGTVQEPQLATNSTVKQVETRPDDCHSSVKPMNVTKAVNGSLTCEWNELNFLATLPWLHKALLNKCSTKEESTFWAEIEFARSIWGDNTVEALCHWIVPVEDGEIPPLILTVDPVLEDKKNDTDVVKKDDVVCVDPVRSDELKDVIEDDQRPMMQQQQTESVFMQFLTRIKALEKNMSLSGQYLEELSRNYKKQVDDMQKSLNRTLQTLNEVTNKMIHQEERHQKEMDFLKKELDEVKSVTKMLEQENLNLKSQVIESHLVLMLIELAIIVSVVVFLLRRWRVTSQNPPPSPRAAVVSRSFEAMPAQSSNLTLNVSNLTNKKQQVSPTPSLAESTSSGCESAFSFAASVPSREPSPVTESRPSAKHAKKQKKKNKSADSLPTRSLSTGPVRLKSDNWEWHSRAKILAAQFIKENYDSNGALRCSF